MSLDMGFALLLGLVLGYLVKVFEALLLGLVLGYLVKVFEDKNKICKACNGAGLVPRRKSR
jgi:hypothetical protein